MRPLAVLAVSAFLVLNSTMCVSASSWWGSSSSDDTSSKNSGGGSSSKASKQRAKEQWAELKKVSRELQECRKVK